MRQIDEREVRALGFDDLRRCLGDPLGTWQARHWTPESVEWKLAEFALKPMRQFERRAGDAEDFVAVSAVPRLRGDADRHVGALIEPPEEFRAFEFRILFPSSRVDRF